MRETKLGKCLFCCPDGGAILDGTYGQPEQIVPAGAAFNDHVVIDPDSEDVPTWECRNCGMHQPGKRDVTKWTPSQERALDRIKKFWEEDRKEYDWGYTETICSKFEAERSEYTGVAIVSVRWETIIVNTHGESKRTRYGSFIVSRRGAIVLNLLGEGPNDC